MARFFFDWSDYSTIEIDEDGVDLPDVATVEREATRSLIERACDVLPDKDRRILAIHVRDATSQPVLSVKLKLTVDLSPFYRIPLRER